MVFIMLHFILSAIPFCLAHFGTLNSCLTPFVFRKLLNSFEVNSSPLYYRKIFSVQLVDFSTWVFHSWNQPNNSCLFFNTCIKTKWVLPSMNVKKCLAPLSDCVLIFTSLWTNLSTSADGVLFFTGHLSLGSLPFTHGSQKSTSTDLQIPDVIVHF